MPPHREVPDAYFTFGPRGSVPSGRQTLRTADLAFAGHARVAVRVFRTERGVEARRHLPTLRLRRGSFGSEPSPVRRRHRPAWRYFRLLLPQHPRALGVGRGGPGEQIERGEHRDPPSEPLLHLPSSAV